MIHARQSHTINSEREQEYLAGWQRARAELTNFRKRTQEERARDAHRLTVQLLERLLPVLDNFHAIAAHQPAELADNAWAQGVTHVVRQLDALLTEYGVETIAATGVAFDPALHHAVEQVANSTAASGTVLTVTQRGFRLGSTIIRPATVTVAA